MTMPAVEPIDDTTAPEAKPSNPRLVGEARAIAKRVATEVELITGAPEALSLTVDLMVRYCGRLGDPRRVAELLLEAVGQDEEPPR